MPASMTACWKCAFLSPALGSASARKLHRKNGTAEGTDWINLKGSLIKSLAHSPATRKWSCLLKKHPASEKDIFPVSACTSNFDEWSALAGFLADMIEKYAEVLIPEIESKQIPVDELLAA